MKAKYILQILPLLFVLGMTSCSKEESTSAEEAKEYNVSLKFNGEITTADTPLTRGTATNDLIGVQVYQDGTLFREGLFDNTEDLHINLFSDSKYRFVVTIVKDGKNIVVGKNNQFKNGYYTPFGYRLKSNGFDYPSDVNNEFEETSNRYFHGLGSGRIRMTLSDYGDVDYPEADRFYGELDNYTPTENGEVAIDLKRTAFGLKYEVSGVTDGTVSVKIENSSRTFFENTEITSEYESEERIFSFNDVYSAWKYANNYTESITVSASWARGVGITQDLGSKTVQIKRNAMNIIRLKLGSVDYDGNIGIEVEEETDMNEETVTGTLE